MENYFTQKKGLGHYIRTFRDPQLRVYSRPSGAQYYTKLISDTEGRQAKARRSVLSFQNTRTKGTLQTTLTCVFIIHTHIWPVQEGSSM